MLLSNPLMVYLHVYKEAKSLTDAGNEVTVVAWDRKKEYEPESNIDGTEIVISIKTGFLNRYREKQFNKERLCFSLHIIGELINEIIRYGFLFTGRKLGGT